MSSSLRDLTLRLRSLIARKRVERELDEELAFHIECETRKLIDGGMKPSDARNRAMARFGPVALAADNCRDARGTALVDDTIRDVQYALRTFKRAPLAAFTIAATVGLGLGLVAVCFTLLNTFLFQADAVKSPDELFGVERVDVVAGIRGSFTRTDFDALRAETDVFSDTFAMLPGIHSRIEGRLMEGTFVTDSFFDTLGVHATLGRTLMTGDDERPTGRPVVVLSHEGWSRLFEKDPGVLGRTLVVHGFPFEIVGVAPAGFRGLTAEPPDYFAPLSTIGRFQPKDAGQEDNLGVDIVGRLKAGLSRSSAIAGLSLWDSRRSTSRVVETRAANITLEPRRGVAQRKQALVALTPLFFAFGLILMIGCANVANLLLARGLSRQKEIGVRLSLGASRPRIVRQILTECLLLALCSAALGFVVSRVVLEGVIHAVMTTMPADFAEAVRFGVPTADWRVGLFLLLGSVLATVVFGLAPALQATRLELVRTMRGEITTDARPNRARNVLIGVQVTASALLLIVAAVFLRSAFTSTAAGPGFRTADTAIIEVTNEPLREALVRAVATDFAVLKMAAYWPDAIRRPRTALANSNPSTASSVVPYRFVSPEYFDVLDIGIVRGRGFTSAERNVNTGVVVVSESVAKMLWPGADAVGQVMNLAPDPQSKKLRKGEPVLPVRAFTVVGVARDVAGLRMSGSVEAGLYLPIDAATERTSLVVRVQGDPDIARRGLLERLTVVDPDMGLVVTLRMMAQIETYFLRVGFWITFGLSSLALILTLSGLFSVLSYLVEQRAKEVGVRMALGATTRDVARLVLSESGRLVGVGLVAGTALAAALGIVLMSTPAAVNIARVVHVFDPLAYAGSLAFILIACLTAAVIPALRASRISPVQALRQD